MRWAGRVKVIEKKREKNLFAPFSGLLGGLFCENSQQDLDKGPLYEFFLSVY